MSDMTSEPCTIVLSDGEDSELAEVGSTTARNHQARLSRQAGDPRLLSASNRPRTRRRVSTATTPIDLRASNATGRRRVSDVIDLTSTQGSNDLLVISSSRPRQRAKKSGKQSHAIVINDDTPPQTPHGAQCGICFERMDEKMACGPCGHVFCEKCLREAVKVQKKCPTCRKGLQLRQIHKVFITM